MIRIALIFSFLCLAARGYAQKMLGSFEKEADLKNVSVTGSVAVSRSTDFPAVGAYSLKAVFPASGGSIHLKHFTATRWNREIVAEKVIANTLLLFIWAADSLKITVLVTDSQQHTAAKPFMLKRGANHLQLSFSDLKNIDLEHVAALTVQSGSAGVCFIDYVALDEFQPVLAQYGRWDVQYSTNVKTNHFPWASPLTGGKIKSYSISPVFDGRGIIELAERLDLDYKVTTLGRNPAINRWGFGDFYNRRNPLGDDGEHPNSLVFNYIADDLLYAAEFDVIIWPGLHPWESYPVAVRNAILKRVEGGTGLLLIYPNGEDTGKLWSVSPIGRPARGILKTLGKVERENEGVWPYLDTTTWVLAKPHFITRGIALEAFPNGHMGVVPMQGAADEVLLKTARGNPVLAAGTYGKGRVVAMSYAERGLIPRVDDPWETGIQLPYWEYMWSLVARAVVWSAKKEPETFIRSIVHSAGGLRVQLHNVTEGAALSMQVIDAFGNVEQDTTFALTAGLESLQIPPGKLIAGGMHIASFRLTGNKGIYDWYSLAFTTKQAATIASIQIKKPEIPVGEQVEASLTLQSPNTVSAVIKARLCDNYGRLVDESEHPVSISGKTRLNVRFKSGNVLTHLGKTDFSLIVHGRETDHKTKELFFLQPRVWDDYDVTMYHFGPNPFPGTWNAIDSQLRNVHVTTLAAYTVANSKHANYKVQAQTRINGMESSDDGPDLAYYESMKRKYLQTGDKSVLVRKYGLNDSVFLRSVRADLKKKVAEWKKFSPSAYYIYEEPSITRYDDALDLDFSRTTLSAMRIWLKQQYGSLEALNRQWGTAFKSWATVVPDDTREAQKRGNSSSWADHRSFMEKTWAGQFKYVQDALNTFDPGGLVQLSGTQASGAHNGYDYSQIDQYVGQMNPYDIGNQLEYHRNFNPAVKISGQGGYGALGKGVLYDFYQHVFVNETAGAYIFWQQSVLNPDFSICKSGLYLKEALHEMRELGIGKLVSRYLPENENKVAIHYSYPSIHGAWITDGKIDSGDVTGVTSKTLEQFRKNLDGWVKLLHDAGVGFDFMAYSGIEADQLVSKGYKVLVLPMSIALSDKEVAQIQKFVQQGGTVIADALPGVMDGHTRFRTGGGLSAVFGLLPQTYLSRDVAEPRYDKKLKVNDARYTDSEAGRPVLLSHDYGSGKAFLLNYFLDGYPEEKLKKANDASLTKFRKVLAAAGIDPGIKINAASGLPTSGITKYSFSHDNGSGRLLGLLPEEGITDTTIAMQLKDSAHVYDLRSHKYLGSGNRFRLRVTPGVPMLLGLLKGIVREVDVNSPAVAARGEKITGLIQCSTGEGLQLHSVATVAVYNPNGNLVGSYSGNSGIDNNKGTFSFATALNDPAGEWIIEVKEVISGIAKQVKIQIR